MKRTTLIISEKEQKELNELRKKLGFEEEKIIKNMEVGILFG